MGIPKPIASIDPDASNAPVSILPNNAYGKINQTTSNVLICKSVQIDVTLYRFILAIEYLYMFRAFLAHVQE
jgi:hypothetical protein